MKYESKPVVLTKQVTSKTIKQVFFVSEAVINNDYIASISTDKFIDIVIEGNVVSFTEFETETFYSVPLSNVRTIKYGK